MRPSLAQLVLWGSLGVARAAEPTAAASTGAPVASASPEVTALQAEVARVQAEASAARTGRSEVEADRDALAAILAQAAVLLDERKPPAARVAAAEALGQRGDPRALPTLRAGARDPVPEVQRASLEAAALSKSEEAVTVVVLVASQARGDNQDRAFALLEGWGAEAGDALWTLAGDRGVDGSVRRRAHEILEEKYPDVLARRGAPEGVGDLDGAVLGIAANGVAGGVLLSSVGVWGQLDSGVAIGGAGGAAIGVGTGILYAAQEPVTRGEGWAYTSGVGFGLFTGTMAQKMAFGRSDLGSIPRTEDEEGWAALLRVVGVGAGAGVGYAVLRQDPAPKDVLEVDVAGILGGNVALAAVDLTRRAPEYTWEAREPVDTSGWDESANVAWEDYERTIDEDARVRAGVTLAGTALGLGGGALLVDRWDLDVDDLVFSGVVGAEAAWIGGFAPAALDVPERSTLRGNVRLPLHTGIAAGLLVAELHPVSVRQSLLGAYGMVAGNALGAGIPMSLGAQPGPGTIESVMLPVGGAGTVAGFLLADRAGLEGGDWAMIGVGVPIALAEASAIGVVLDEEGLLERSEQAAGIVLTTGSLAGVGLAALGSQVDPDPVDMALLGSAAVWGTWFGALTPVAFDAQWSTSLRVGVATATADAFLVGTGLLLTPAVGLEPGATVLPQLGGLTGATLGALGLAMFSDETHLVAAGAVGGSLVGMGAGAVLGGAIDAPLLPRPDLGLPGRWSGAVTPDGDGGWQASLRVDGL